MKIENKVRFSLFDYKKGRKVYECLDSLCGDECREVKPEIHETHLSIGADIYSLKGVFMSDYRQYDFTTDLFHDGDDNFAKYGKQKKQYYVKKKKKK